jgi:hypothetical protein
MVGIATPVIHCMTRGLENFTLDDDSDSDVDSDKDDPSNQPYMGTVG